MRSIAGSYQQRLLLSITIADDVRENKVPQGREKDGDMKVMCSSAWVKFPGSEQDSDVRPCRLQGHILVRERHRFQGMNYFCWITA
jgi:hypothetical protein